MRVAVCVLTQVDHTYSISKLVTEVYRLPTGVISSASPLSGFTRRLFLQVLLEDEKLLVAIQTTSKQFRWEINKINSHIQHPKFGAGRLYRTMVTSLQSTCAQVISKVSGKPGLSLLGFLPYVYWYCISSPSVCLTDLFPEPVKKIWRLLLTSKFLY